jgi:hypothetical protein
VHFLDQKRLAREVGLVHGAPAFYYYAIRRAYLMGKNHQPLTNLNLGNVNVHDLVILFAVSDARHSFGQRAQYRRSPPRRVFFQSRAAGEHQHNDGTGQILTQYHGGDNGDARQQVRAKISCHGFTHQIDHQRRAAYQQDGD